MIFMNPRNGYKERVAGKLSWLWLLLFGPIFLAIKGVWGHVVGGIILAFVTFGISWFIYPFFTYSILKKSYLRKGWVEVDKL
jgi:hypothetical protein